MRDLLTAIRRVSIVLFFLVAIDVSGQSLSQSLSTVLNGDGSLNQNASGSFDPTGYRMTSGPNGEPRFVPSGQPSLGGCVDNWDTNFIQNGANDDVNVIVSDGAGKIYIGGDFTSIQGVAANRVAVWDGLSWSGLGTGVSGTVNAIAVDGMNVYVGGNFFSAGGVPSRNAAKWNGSSWSAMGAGLGGGTHVVEAIAVYGGAVYVGGNFNIADGSPANGLVKWDGTAYSSAGTQGTVNVLTVNGGSLYIAGAMNVIADTSLSGLVKWDGVSFTGFGLTSNSDIGALGINGSDIYAGGTVRTATLNAVIAKWSGGTWTSLGSSLNGVPRAFAFLGSDVYAGGTFERTGGIGIGNGVLKYNGSWNAIGTGTEFGEVNAIYANGNTFLIGGVFDQAGDVGARNLATLTNGTTWAAAFPGTGPDNSVRAITISGTDVYIGGTFRSVGTVAAHRIAKWNTVTNTWSTLGTGLSGFTSENSSISAIAVVGNKVYAGGTFSNIGGVFTSNIAMWNGTAWTAMGTGLNASVGFIIAKGEDIYVGGSFTAAGAVTTNRVAKWNGTAWSSLNSAILPTTVSGMAFMGNDLYVGTGTTTVANPAYFSKYDGTNWTALGAELGDRGVSSVAVIGTDVYVAGGFTSIGGVTVNGVARWNGSSWFPVGNGIPSNTGQPSFPRLAVSGPNLIAFGAFTVATGGPADRIAKWNGTTWLPFGSGLNGGASAVTAAGGDIFVGGSFTTAGCRQSANLARWRETVWTGATSTDWHTASNWGGSSVPAANAGVTIQASNATISSADVSVGSLIVAGGRTLAVAAGRTLTVNGNLDLANGFLTGPGTVVINGDLSILSGDITNLASLTVNGSLNLNSGTISGTGPVSLTDCRVTALVGGSSTSYITSPFTRCVSGAGTFKFPVGTGLVYAPVELSNVTGSGNFTVEPKAGAYAGAATGLPANRLQRWWNLTNGGGITQADLAFNYVDGDVVGTESRYRVYRINGGTATQMTTTPNTTLNRAVVTGVTSFSPWTMAEGTPFPLTLSGRVTNSNGRGAAHILVSLTDSQGNTYYRMTTHLGYYRFLNVSTFQQVTVRVTSKKYTFTAPERVIDFDEFTPAINFVSSDN